LIVEAVEERHLLRPVAGVVGRVQVVAPDMAHAVRKCLRREDDLSRLPVPVESDVVPHQQSVQAGHLAGCGPVFEAAQSRLRGERIVLGPPVAGQLQHRVGAHPVVIVLVLVASDQAEDALAKEVQDVQFGPVLTTGVVDKGRGLGEPAQPLVELAHSQKAGVGGYLAALEIRDELLMLVETEGQLPATVCHLKASPAVDSKSRSEPIVAPQEAFSLGHHTSCAE
jgi:hypothetical protein